MTKDIFLRYKIFPSPGLASPGHLSLCHLIDLLYHKYSQSHFIRLSHDPMADLLWWSSFLLHWIILSFYLSLLVDTVRPTGF